MQKILFVLFSLTAVVFGQTWVQRARVKDHTEFFTSVMQDTVYELERRGWCNLKLTDVSLNVNWQMYKWLVNGTALFTNGFVVSIQKIDVTTMSQQVTNPTINGVVVPRALVSGQLNMWNVKLGYDVFANLTDIGEQRYTGDMTLEYITWTINIIKQLDTNEITLSLSSRTSGGIRVRMVFRPANNITEVLSRNFFPYHNGDGVSSWRQIMSPIIMDIITNKIPFPEICFSNC